MILVTKKPHAYRTIGEAAKAVGVPAHVLRFWETKFSQIRPMKKGGGRRYYRPEDISLLCGIRVYLYDRTYSIKDLQQLLKADGCAPVVKAGASAAGFSSPEPEPEPAPVKVVAPEAEKQPKPVPVEIKETVTTKPEPAATSSTDEPLRNALARLQGARNKLSGTMKKV